MKYLLRKYLSKNKNTIWFGKSIIILVLSSKLFSQTPIANYISNGGFEVLISNTITSGGFNLAKYWSATDTTKSGYFFCSTTPSIANAPYISTGFQYPRNGYSFALSQFYCDTCPGNPRGYPRNRLKQMLQPSKVYCAKYHVVNTNNNRVAIDKYGMYFGDATLDTITKCLDPITYLNPQVENQSGIITDTLNWIAVSGTFVATGSEKYCLLGNFRTNAATNTLLLQPAFPFNSNDVYIDDVSVIEIDLPAYAGPDKWFIPGDSVYIGRESDVEIDESCIWYQMTSPTTSITIDTIAGLYVKPVSTTTYVVRQQLWCSGVKWDTVVVSLSGVGVAEMLALQNDIKLFPNPAADEIQIHYNLDMDEPFSQISFYNRLGQLIYQENMTFKNKKASMSIANLENGVYSLELKNAIGQTVKKRFVVAR